MKSRSVLQLLSIARLVTVSIGLCGSFAFAQHPKPKTKTKPGKGAQPEIRVATPPKPSFRPTYNGDSGSVSRYFFPANLGAKWTMRTVMQTFNDKNEVMKSDTVYSFERVTSDSDRTLTGWPVLTCESSYPYHWGDELTARTQQSQYYIDDSAVVAVFNHSITSNLNHTLLVNPLHVGMRWREKQDDTVYTEVVSMHEPVTVPVGSFTNAMVLRTTTKAGELSKYLVPGVGILKTVYRGILPAEGARPGGTFVVTSELIDLDRGDPSHNLRAQYARVLNGG